MLCCTALCTAALMQDQVGNLRARGVQADYLSSTRTASERQAILDRLAAGGGGLTLLYITPESVRSQRCEGYRNHALSRSSYRECCEFCVVGVVGML